MYHMSHGRYLYALLYQKIVVIYSHAIVTDTTDVAQLKRNTNFETQG